MRNKKAAIGATMVWVFATFIIIFILFVFLAIASGLRIKKGGMEQGIENKGGDVASMRVLSSVLSSEIEINGEKEKVFDAVKGSLDGYVETKNDRGESLFDWAEEEYLKNTLESIDSQSAIKQGFDVKALNDIDYGNVELAEKIGGNLKSICDDFYLRLPQGVVSIGDGKPGLYRRIYDDDFFNSEKPELTRTFSIEFPYRNKIFEIKFRMLKKCLEE